MGLGDSLPEESTTPEYRREWLERRRVVLAAHSWLGTKYHDCAFVKGHGVDCAYLLKGVFEDAGLVADVAIPKYSPQWYLHRDEEVYLGIVRSYMRDIDEAQAMPGDVVLYRFGRCYSHGAIIIEPGFPAVIHAYKQAGAVVLGEGASGDLKKRNRLFFSHWGR